MYNKKSTRAHKHSPVKKERQYADNYGASYKRDWIKNHPNACVVQACPFEVLSGNLCEKHRISYCIRNRKCKLKRKILVLSHYGPNGILQCSWHGCTVCDIDMLSLDHVYNDGAEARKKGYDGCGDGLYRKVKREGFPAGYQTLCHNHQWKKEIMRRNEIFEKEVLAINNQ